MIELEVQLAKNNHQIEVDLSSSILYAISPTAKIELIQNGNYLITITDKNGTTLAEIPVVNKDTINSLLTQYFNEDPVIQEYIQNFLSNLTFDLSDRMAKGVDGSGNEVSGAVIEGIVTGRYANKATNTNAHAEGNTTKAEGYGSHAEGNGTTATGSFSHAEGSGTKANLDCSHAEGMSTTAGASCAHAEGNNTTASGNYSHAEGGGTVASGYYSHAEGGTTKAQGNGSHAEGGHTTASGDTAHAEGSNTIASGASSHAEGGQTTASGILAHAEGSGTIAAKACQHVLGAYNIAETGNGNEKGTYVEIVGNGFHGNGVDNRSNARTLDWNGNEKLAGSLTLGMGTQNEVTITAAQLKQLLQLL